MREVRSSGAKELERTRIEDFHERSNLAGCSRACGGIRVHVPAAEIFLETSNISGFYLGFPLFPPRPPQTFKYIFYYYFGHTM